MRMLGEGEGEERVGDVLGEKGCWVGGVFTTYIHYLDMRSTEFVF